MNNVIFLIVFAAFFTGSIAPFAKLALERFQPFTVVVNRFMSASLVLLPFVYLNNELRLKIF